MEVRVRIIVGGWELEYEGSEEFLSSKMPSLVQQFSNFVTLPTTATESTVNRTNDQQSTELPASRPLQKLSTKTIANRLRCTTGIDLVIAASAHLRIVEGREEFTQKDILVDMQNATGFYKASTHRNNLTKLVDRLVRAGKLHETRKGVYVLDAAEQERLRSQLELGS